jgi:hypothetical protein
MVALFPRFAAGAAKKKDKLLTMDSSEITYEMVAKKLREIVTSRGRKGTDKQEQVRPGSSRSSPKTQSLWFNRVVI